MSLYASFEYNPATGRRERAMVLSSNRMKFGNDILKCLAAFRAEELSPTEKRALTKAEKELPLLQKGWDSIPTSTLQEEDLGFRTLQETGWTYTGKVWKRVLPEGASLHLQRVVLWHDVGWRLLLKAPDKDYVELQLVKQEGLLEAYKMYASWKIFSNWTKPQEC